MNVWIDTDGSVSSATQHDCVTHRHQVSGCLAEVLQNGLGHLLGNKGVKMMNLASERAGVCRINDFVGCDRRAGAEGFHALIQAYLILNHVVRYFG